MLDGMIQDRAARHLQALTRRRLAGIEWLLRQRLRDRPSVGLAASEPYAPPAPTARATKRAAPPPTARADLAERTDEQHDRNERKRREALLRRGADPLDPRRAGEIPRRVLPGPGGPAEPDVEPGHAQPGDGQGQRDLTELRA